MSSQQTNETSGGCSTLTPKREQKPDAKSAKNKPRQLPPYHVLLLDDNDHSYEYVIEMMRALFGYPTERGYRIADEVNSCRRAVVFTAHKELAELKRDMIHSYGADERVATCVGSMSAVIIPAEL